MSALNCSIAVFSTHLRLGLAFALAVLSFGLAVALLHSAFLGVGAED